MNAVSVAVWFHDINFNRRHFYTILAYTFSSKKCFPMKKYIKL